MALTNHKRYFLAAFIALLTSSAHAGIMDFVSGIQEAVQKTLSINEIEPYIIPLEQGRLVEEKNFKQLDVGLSREQVKYLLGKPTSSPFNNDHWNYYYYNNLNSKDPVAMGLFSQKDLLKSIEKAEKKNLREKKEKEKLSSNNKNEV